MTAEEKFKYYAARVDTPEKIAELCRKYLEKKGDTTMGVKTVYIGGDKLVTVNAHSSIGMEEVATYGSVTTEVMMKKDIGNLLLHEILTRDLISWQSARDHYTNSMKYYGKLNIWTGDKK